jgi:hypothetical protein
MTDNQKIAELVKILCAMTVTEIQHAFMNLEFNSLVEINLSLALALEYHRMENEKRVRN